MDKARWYLSWLIGLLARSLHYSSFARGFAVGIGSAFLAARVEHFRSYLQNKKAGY